MKDMKFVVLIWAVFQMLSFTASDINSTTTESYTLINSTNLTKPGCNSTCGNLTVPYPFGFGNNPECYINEGFRIYCNTSLNPPKATIKKGGYNNSIKLISDSTIRLSNTLASSCSSPNGTIDNFATGMEFGYRPYSLSKVNKFTVIGCGASAFLMKFIEKIQTYRKNTTGPVVVNTAGCMVFCGEFPVDSDECTGNGCCQSPIADGITDYITKVYNTSLSDSYTRMYSTVTCTYAFVGEENAFKFKGANDLNDTNLKKRIEATVPIVLEWAIGNRSCSETKATDGYACQSNSKCVSSTRKSGGYRCECKEGYEGNPYLSPGCQDIDECARPKKYPCYGVCINIPGSYNCMCRRGYNGNAKIPNGCKRSAAGYSKFTTIIFILGIVLGIGILVLSIGAYKLIQKRKDKRRKEKFFKRNGGLLLQQQISSGEHATQTTRMFSAIELEKATDQYNRNRILGRGGQGTVYKGMLPDGKIVAVKK